MYAGADDFAARATPIILRALEADRPVLIAIDKVKIGLLRDHLGSAGGAIAWMDIRGIGGNPARIIPVWRQFVARHGANGPLLGFGEPIWAGRTAAELVEAQRHEQLLNVAFARADGFTLICPYDTSALDASVIGEAHHSHPIVAEADARPSTAYPGLDVFTTPFDDPLAYPPREPAELPLDGVPAATINRFLVEQATDTGLTFARIEDLTLAVAAVQNSMGRPGTRLHLWWEDGTVVVEIRHLAPLVNPLAGREWPPPQDGPTRGLWLANQLCDLVELRSFDTGAVVRMRLSS